MCEPFDALAEEPFPTLIYGTELAMACDSIEDWTEEEYVGRELAPERYRWYCRSTVARPARGSRLVDRQETLPVIRAYIVRSPYPR